MWFLRVLALLLALEASLFGLSFWLISVDKDQAALAFVGALVVLIICLVLAIIGALMTKTKKL